MFLVGLIVMIVIAAVCSARLGPGKAILVLAILGVLSALIAVQASSGELVVFILAYGGGFLLLGGGVGILIGAMFRRRR